jgi:hypothetical protein
MGGCFGQRGNVAADQIKGVALPMDVAFFKLHAAGADGFDFPAFQHQSGFDLFFDKVVVKGFAVVGNAHGGSRGNKVAFGGDCIRALYFQAASGE